MAHSQGLTQSKTSANVYSLADKCKETRKDGGGKKGRKEERILKPGPQGKEQRVKSIKNSHVAIYLTHSKPSHS